MTKIYKCTGTLNFESNSLNAEILWCLNMVNQHLSYSKMEVIKHWEGLSQSQRPKNKSYETLVKYYTGPLMPAKFKFFEYIASVFEPYLTVFQTDAPMIPFIYEQLKEIYDKLLSMVSKIDSLEEASISKKLKASWLNKK